VRRMWKRGRQYPTMLPRHLQTLAISLWQCQNPMRLIQWPVLLGYRRVSYQMMYPFLSRVSTLPFLGLTRLHPTQTQHMAARWHHVSPSTYRLTSKSSSQAARPPAAHVLMDHWIIVLTIVQQTIPTWDYDLPMTQVSGFWDPLHTPSTGSVLKQMSFSIRCLLVLVILCYDTFHISKLSLFCLHYSF
jgi:hypothetical protein